MTRWIIVAFALWMLWQTDTVQRRFDVAHMELRRDVAAWQYGEGRLGR
jgi:hypothetical protein